MAVGEKRSTWVISQVSWTDWTAQDVYYWQEHSFQYSANINCDDEMHGIKLSQKAEFANWINANCQLVSVWGNWVIALNTLQKQNPKIFDSSSFSTWGNDIGKQSEPNPKIDVCPWVVFQDYFWYGIIWESGSWLSRVSNTWAWTIDMFVPCDHPDYTDESISTPVTWEEAVTMQGTVTAILNYNNTRLVVACSSWTTDNASIWVYYPELDHWKYESEDFYWRTWWKKVLEYESWVTIVALTCTFEYLKVRAVDEWWNTKVYYYQGNNNLRSTFVYNVVDLTGVRVTRVYSINWTDYYVSSQDWTDWFVNLYKMVGNTPVPLFHQRWWLDPLDVNFKAPYFVWPCGIDAGYTDWTFYIADTYGLFRFRYTPQWYDKGYMKWKFNTNQEHPYWVCFNQWYLYVSTDKGCYKMRAYDTWVDWFQEEWVLISREYEGKEWGTITKMLDEIRLNYELNPLTNNKWSIDIYVSPNNLWRTTRPEDYTNLWTVASVSDFPENPSENDFCWVTNKSAYYLYIYDDDEWEYRWEKQKSGIIPWWWYKAMHIDNTNWETRAEKSNLFNELEAGSSSFKFDWQTITYAIVIKQTTSTHATPIVRQIDIRYHTKDKVNNVYDIN